MLNTLFIIIIIIYPSLSPLTLMYWTICLYFVFIKRKDVPYTPRGKGCGLSFDGQVGGVPPVGEGLLEYQPLFLSIRLMGPGKIFQQILVSKLSHSMVAPPTHQKGSQSLLQQLEHEYMVCQSRRIPYNCSCQVLIKRWSTLPHCPAHETPTPQYHVLTNRFIVHSSPQPVSGHLVWGFLALGLVLLYEC